MNTRFTTRRVLPFLCLCFLVSGVVRAGADDWGAFPPQAENGVYPYHYRPDRTVDFTHLTLEPRVFMSEMRLEGTARYRFRPLHDRVDRIRLDATRMSVLNVTCDTDVPYHWTYSDNAIHIQFDRFLAAGTESELAVRYTVSRPVEGMYFTDSKHVDPQDPDQLYTLGEPLGGSFWFPAPDYPNDRMVTEMVVTVPREFTTLSNGRLAESREEGTWRTDVWRQEIPHVIYLVSLVVGKFDVVTDRWNDIDVSYYVEKGLADDARPSMGKTPAMIDFYSRYFDTPYPYEKYAQAAVRDFRAGGMEHTIVFTLFEGAAIDEEARLDTDMDSLIAHELAHQWFGDYVTCESWPHLWLNESFATFCDALWMQHDRGEDEYLTAIRDDMQSYFGESRRYTRAIVTNEFKHPMEMFDGHSYPKGAAVLHMLRTQLGDEFFRRSIKTYLDKHAPGLVDTDDLMEAIEETTGRPMDQFFQQWVFRPGHPKVKVTHEWLPERKQVKIRIEQTQDAKEGEPAFAFPLPLEVVTASGTIRQTVQIARKEETAFIDCETAPESVVVDPGLTVLMELEHDKSEDMLLKDLQGGSTIVVRLRAADALSKHPSEKTLAALVETARTKNYWKLQAEAASSLGKIKNRESLETLLALAGHENPKVRRAVADSLGSFYKKPEAAAALRELFRNDPSVRVQETAARAIGRIKADEAYETLRDGLSRKTYGEGVRRGVLDALVDLEEPRAYAELAKYAEDPHGTALRTTAIRGIGRLGHDVEKVEDDALEKLLGYLDSQSDFIRQAAISGLRSLKNEKAVPHLQSVADNDFREEVRRDAKSAIEEIQKDRNTALSAENSRKILEMEKENQSLKDRLDELESSFKKMQESSAKTEAAAEKVQDATDTEKGGEGK